MTDAATELSNVKELIFSGDDEALIALVKRVLAAGIDPGKVMDQITGAIREVGDEYQAGSIFLPELIMAGDTVLKTITVINEDVLSKGLEKVRGKGIVVIGTVEGDVHNIGKDVVAALLMAAGFEVHDLGVNVSIHRFLSEAERFGADIIAMSALMTTTMGTQKSVIRLLEDKGKRAKYRVLVGGGALRRGWDKDIGADGYAADALEAVKVAELVMGR